MSARSRSAAFLILVLGCARSMPPPGGIPDEAPPRIIATVPEPLSVVEPFDGAVVFQFDERLSERNIEGSVVVSPQTGEVHLSRSGSELRVRIDGGWREGVVYRVVVAPGIRDLFNNERREPVDLVFSTGPAIVNTAFGGFVSDRITGRPAAQTVVEATQRADSLVYLAAVDTAGFFAYRNLPLGLYDVMAYADQNRNHRRDASESITPNQVVSLNSERDTTDLDLALVPNDTTPPVLQSAEGRDSLQVRLFTDDYLEPEAPLASIQVRILAMPDSEVVGGVHRLMKVDTFTELMRVRADSIRQDSIRLAALAADTAAADTTAPPPRRLAVPPGRPAQPGRPATSGRGGLPPLGPLPYRELVLIPGQPLAPGEYLVEVTNLMNISRRVGGGGTVDFRIEPPPRPRPDTTAAAPDTGRVSLRRR